MRHNGSCHPGTGFNAHGFSDRRLHRLAEVRKQEGVTLSTIARKMATGVGKVRNQEVENADIRLSDLYKWQEALGVPLAELLVDPTTELSRPIQQRAQLVRVMKTALSIRDRARTAVVRRMAQNMIKLLIEIMPELREVRAWQVVGPYGRTVKFGRVIHRIINEDMLQNDDDIE